VRDGSGQETVTTLLDDREGVDLRAAQALEGGGRVGVQVAAPVRDRAAG